MQKVERVKGLSKKFVRNEANSGDFFHRNVPASFSNVAPSNNQIQ